VSRGADPGLEEVSRGPAGPFADLAVGVPVPELGGAYFEIFPLVELDQTFQVLGAVLVAGVVVIPAGTVLLSRWALGPALRPLEHIGAVARAVAAGDLSARLDPAGDPTLVSIAATFNETAAALERRVRRRPVRRRREPRAS
jgi:methyl-accepting chemotaxis protein